MSKKMFWFLHIALFLAAYFVTGAIRNILDPGYSFF